MNTRPVSSEYAARFAHYIDLAPETDPFAAMRRQLEDITLLYKSLPEQLYDHRYAEGKWTVREVLGHILDTERSIGFRLLLAGRGTGIEAPRADPDLLVRNAEFGRVPVPALLDELALLRAANMRFLENVPEAAWDRTGIVGGEPMTLRAMAFLIPGHAQYHADMVRTRYLGGK